MPLKSNANCAMNGKRYFLDTNAIIQLLAGNQVLLELLTGAEFIGTSVICELEFLSFPNLSDEDRLLFQEFRARIYMVDLSSADERLKNRICSLRSSKRLKLPDAVIAASAAVEDCALITADGTMFDIPGLQVQSYPLR